VDGEEGVAKASSEKGQVGKAVNIDHEGIRPAGQPWLVGDA
jgi:hypothetical protein